MDIYLRENLSEAWETLRQRVVRGEVGILPTDTIYGFSGNALDENVIARVRAIKGREAPFSIIPHSLQWARLLIDESQRPIFDAHISEYTGRYTTLWTYAGGEDLLHFHLRSSGLVSIRLPDHWIYDFARQSGIPLITTSVNTHAEAPMKEIDDLSESLREALDFLVYEGPLKGPPSQIVHCYSGKPFRIDRRDE